MKIFSVLFVFGQLNSNLNSTSVHGSQLDQSIGYSMVISNSWCLIAIWLFTVHHPSCIIIVAIKTHSDGFVPLLHLNAKKENSDSGWWTQLGILTQGNWFDELMRQIEKVLIEFLTSNIMKCMKLFSHLNLLIETIPKPSARCRRIFWDASLMMLMTLEMSWDNEKMTKGYAIKQKQRAVSWPSSSWKHLAA